MAAEDTLFRSMVEVGLVVGILGAILVAGAAVTIAPWYWVFGAGVIGVCGGMLLGVPTGFYYHVLLRRALASVGPVPPRWWLNPTRYHPAIPEGARPSVMRWFYWGAVGWLIAIVGCVLLAIGTFRS